MPSIVETLRELHRLHRLIRELKTATEEGPRLLKQQQARLTKAEAAVADGHDVLTRLKVSAREKEVSLKASHQQIAKYEKQRETASSKKELDAFEHEIAHARTTCAQLEDEILAILGEIEEQTARIPELDKALAQVKLEAAGFEKEEQERQQRLAGELVRAQAELVEVEKAIPSDIRSLYDRLITVNGADGLAAVRDKTCTSCYGELTLHHQRELDTGRLVLCKTCGRALYI
jgi:predicted  nucleic acid-binding Zn-ribbon protein